MLGFVNMQAHVSVVDPGFPVGNVYPLGCGPPMRALLVKMCAKMQELGSVGKACTRHVPPRSANVYKQSSV